MLKTSQQNKYFYDIKFVELISICFLCNKQLNYERKNARKTKNSYRCR